MGAPQQGGCNDGDVRSYIYIHCFTDVYLLTHNTSFWEKVENSRDAAE